MIEIPEEFRVNLLPAIVKSQEEDFIQSKNILGASDVPYGLRKTVLKKVKGIRTEMNNSMFAGKIIHNVLETPKATHFITKRINKGLGLNEKQIQGKRFVELQNKKYIEFKTETKLRYMIEIYPGKYLRMHPDIYSTLYNVEIKTTSIPLYKWGVDLVPYHLMQANLYTGFYHQDIGFILRIDLGCSREEYKHGGFMQSKSKYWKYIWNNYFMLYPYEFNQELFEYTLKRVKQYFNYIDLAGDVSQIPCPRFIFECKDCVVREFCSSPIDKVKMEHFDDCVACGERIKINTTALIRNDKLYHYTDEKGNKYEECVKKCKEAYETI